MMKRFLHVFAKAKDGYNLSIHESHLLVWSLETQIY